jgi:hypothetical protein
VYEGYIVILVGRMGIIWRTSVLDGVDGLCGSEVSLDVGEYWLECVWGVVCE